MWLKEGVKRLHIQIIQNILQHSFRVLVHQVLWLYNKPHSYLTKSASLGEFSELHAGIMLYLIFQFRSLFSRDRDL